MVALINDVSFVSCRLSVYELLLN